MAQVTDPDVRRVCALTGAQVKILQGKLLSLEDAESMLRASIQEVQKAADDEAFWGAMIVCAKIVQVSCDLTIAALEEETGPVGKGISVLYDVSKIIVDALNGEFDAKEGFKFSANVHADILIQAAKRKGPKFAKVSSDIKTLANLGDDLFDFFSKKHVGISGGLQSAKRSAIGTLNRIDSQISRIEASLAACR